MTLDEAIAHAREVAERNRKQYKNCPSDRTDIRYQTCEECAKQHEQLAQWLEDYKYIKQGKKEHNGCHSNPHLFHICGQGPGKNSYHIL